MFLKCGVGVIYFTIIGGIITFIYSFMSKIKLSEFAIAIIYGPAIFGGVYYENIQLGSVFIICSDNACNGNIIVYSYNYGF